MLWQFHSTGLFGLCPLNNFIPLVFRGFRKKAVVWSGLISVLKQSSQVFFNRVVLKKFANLTGKHLCWINTGVFLWNLRNFLEHLFFTEHFRWLLLPKAWTQKIFTLIDKELANDERLIWIYMDSHGFA